MKIGTRSWNFRRDLHSGALSIEGLLREAAEMGLDGVELLARQFPQFTLQAAERFQRVAAHLGIEIAAYAMENDFAHYSAEVRRAEVETVCRWIGLAGAVGVPYVKLFTGDRDPRVEEGRQREWVRECLVACAEAAEAHGVTVAVENHSSVCFTWPELRGLVEEVGRESCKACPDVYNFSKHVGGEVIYQAAEALAALTPYSHLQFYEIDPSGRERHVDIPRLLAIYERNGYNGYYMIEWDGKDDPYWAVSTITRYLRALSEKSGK